MKDLNKLKVAIVCDWLTGIGGAELVILEIHRMFPQAPIYTSQYDKSKITWFNDADVRTTWVNKLPNGLKKFLPVLRAYSFSHLDLSDYDLVISSSSAEAKSVKTGPNTIHVNYCHSPTHYYWTRYDDYMAHPGFGAFNWLARIGLKLLVGPMRKWDYKAAQKPNYLIANSNYTKENIKKYYGRDSEVVFPPVDVGRFKTANKENREGFIIVGRQTPYKKIDLAVSALTELKLPLTVIGDGPEHEKLMSVAGDNIKFLGQINDEEKNNLLSLAKAFIFPGIDDFGIAAVEALAAGTPVIAYEAGGALDYINKDNGVFFEKQINLDLEKAIDKFNRLNFDNTNVQKSADKFSIGNFRKNLTKFLESL